MKSACMVCAVAALTTAATAQQFTIGPSVTHFFPVAGETFAVDIVGDASVGTHMLGGSFSVESTDTMGLIESMVWQPASWSAFNTDGGHQGGGDYASIIFGQLLIPDVPPFDVPAPGSELGGLIGTFLITVSDDYLNQEVDFHLQQQDPFSLEVIDIDTGMTFRSSDGSLALGHFSIGIPSPGVCSLLGFAGLAAARRRR